MLALPCAVGDTRELKGLRELLLARQINNQSDVEVWESIRSGAIETGELSALLAYHHLLCGVLVPRLQGDENEAKLEFSWSDPFIKAQGKLISSKLHFEWGNTLWNYGAAMSLQGAKMDLSTDDSIRDACKSFQQACGAFEYIKQKILPELLATSPPTSTSGLCETGVIMASALTLAQAQFCFYKKASKDHKSGSMKAGIVAKLAKQTAVLYAATAAACKPEMLKGDATWFAHADFKAKCFHATAEYWQALALQETVPGSVPGRGYGEAIARLGVAERLLNAASAQAAQYKLPSAVAGTSEELLRAVRTMRGESERLNDSVYLGAVPPEITLDGIVPVSMAKPIVLPPEPGATPQLFRQLVPAHLRKLQAALHERATTLKSNASKQAATATDAARSLLSSIGLPSSLELYKQGEKTGGGFRLPESLWNKVAVAQQQGGLTGLENSFRQVEATAAECRKRLEALGDFLAQEDGAASVEIALTPGSNSGGLDDIRQGKGRMQAALAEARASDASWSEALMSDAHVRGLVDFLCLTADEMVATVPVPEVPLLDFLDGSEELRGTEPAVVELESLLVRMVGILACRDAATAKVDELCTQDFAEALVTMNHRDGMSSASGSTGAANGDAHADMVDNLLQPATPHFEALCATIKEQEELLPLILAANSAFQSLRSNDPATQAKEALVKKVEMAIAQHGALASNLGQAGAFYAALLRRLEELSLEAQDVALARNMMREEWAQQAQQQSRLSNQERADRELAERLEREMQGVSLGAATAAGAAVSPTLQIAAAHGGPAQAAGSWPLSSSTASPGQAGLGPMGSPSVDAATHMRGAPPQYASLAAPPGGGSQQFSVPGIPQGVSYGTPVAGPPTPAALPPHYQPQPQAQPQPQQQWQQQYTYPTQSPPQQQLPQYGQYPQPPPQQQQLPQYGQYPQPPPQQQQLPQYGQYPQPQQQLPQYSNYPGGVTPPVSGLGGGIPPEPSRMQRMSQMGLTDSERATLDAKATRLCEMGFDRGAATDALVANGMNEEAALNALLGTPNVARGGHIHPQVQQPPPPGPPKSSGAGLFGMKWGK